MSKPPYSPDDITFCIKTIHRPWSCHRLVESLRKHFVDPKIVVVDDGRVVETGTHDDLMAADGVYKKLVELQLN